MRPLVCIILCLALWAASAPAAVHRAVVPLRDGRLGVASLTHALADLLHMPDMAVDSGVSIPVRGLQGMLWVKAFNAALGQGCHISTSSDALTLSIDPQKLPHSIRSIKQAVRLFTATAAPDATAAQQRQWGLILPQHLSADRPLIILIHGLDCDGTDWRSMADLLKKSRYQVAYFQYPDDQPIRQSADLFARHMQSLHEIFPRLTVDLVTHSMGALVARGYLEGPDYAGGVRHLIMIAPPNHGSRWAVLQPLLEIHQQYESWRHDPAWRWTWFITDGLGEAGSDLEPDSRFLRRLNAGHRRGGVQYTIIAGDHTPWQKWETSVVAAAGSWLGPSLDALPGVDLCRAQLEQWAGDIRSRHERTDGVVSVKSASLAGVGDLVVLPEDHEDLYRAVDDQPPAAWPVVAQRLAR